MVEDDVSTLFDGMSSNGKELAMVCIADIRESEIAKSQKMSKKRDCTTRLFGRIKTMCKINRITVARLCKEIGIPQSTLAKWDMSEPGVWRLKKVADYFGIGIDDLISTE